MLTNLAVVVEEEVTGAVVVGPGAATYPGMHQTLYISRS